MNPEDVPADLVALAMQGWRTPRMHINTEPERTEARLRDVLAAVLPEVRAQALRDRPTVVCICGSMRFMDSMMAASVGESLHGRIVLLPLVNMKKPDTRWATVEQQEQIKTNLDSLHFAKIDLADEILVVNPGRYIGDSTKREIAYAEQSGKRVRYLIPMEPVRAARLTATTEEPTHEA